jgi:hypothetical protein
MSEIMASAPLCELGAERLESLGMPSLVDYPINSSSNALASFKSAVSKPSVNHP